MVPCQVKSAKMNQNEPGLHSHGHLMPLKKHLRKRVFRSFSGTYVQKNSTLDDTFFMQPLQLMFMKCWGMYWPQTSILSNRTCLWQVWQVTPNILIQENNVCQPSGIRPRICPNIPEILLVLFFFTEKGVCVSFSELWGVMRPLHTFHSARCTFHLWYSFQTDLCVGNTTPALVPFVSFGSVWLILISFVPHMLGYSHTFLPWESPVKLP